MTQEQFENLSVDEVKNLNGEENNEDVTTAWRAGYLYAQAIIRKAYQEQYQNEFFDSVGEFIGDNLSEFKD